MKTVVRIICAISLLLLASCGSYDANEIMRSVQEELPGSEIISVKPRLAFHPLGLLRYSTNVEIQYKDYGSTAPKTVTWFYLNPYGKGWHLFAKKPFSEISNAEYIQTEEKLKLMPWWPDESQRQLSPFQDSNAGT